MPVTTPPTIPLITEPLPLSTDPTNFDERADQAWEDLQVSIAAMNGAASATNANALAAAAAATLAEGERIAAETAAAAAVSATDYMRRSPANLSVGAGAKAVTGLNVPGAAAFEDGDEILLVAEIDAEIRQWGVASATNAGAGTMTVTVAGTDFAGTGPVAGWIVMHRAFEGLTASTVAQIWAGTANVVAVPPGMLALAQASQTFTEPGAAGTFTFNGLNGWSFHTTVTGAGKTLGNPSNFKAGQSGRLRFAVGASAGALAFGSAWKFPFGAPVTASTNGLVFVISYYVHDASNIEAVYLPNMQS